MALGRIALKTRLSRGSSCSAKDGECITNERATAKHLGPRTGSANKMVNADCQAHV